MTAKSRRPEARVMVQAEDMARLEDHEQRIRALEFIDYPVVLKIKLTGDRDSDEPPVLEPRLFTVPIDLDMDGLRLEELYSALGTLAGTDDVEYMIDNETQAQSMLTSDAGVPFGDFTEDSSAVIDIGNNQVFYEDILVISCTQGDSDARGLGITMIFR